MNIQTNKTHHILLKTIHFQYHTKHKTVFVSLHHIRFIILLDSILNATHEYEEIKKRQTDTHIRRDTLRHPDSQNQQTNEPIGHQNTEKVTSCICQFVLRPARIVHMLGVPF